MTSTPPERNSLGSFTNVGKVECVECPACLFTFAAEHTDCGSAELGYTCDCGYSADPEPTNGGGQ